MVIGLAIIKYKVLATNLAAVCTKSKSNLTRRLFTVTALSVSAVRTKHSNLYDLAVS